MVRSLYDQARTPVNQPLADDMTKVSETAQTDRLASMEVPAPAVAASPPALAPAKMQTWEGNNLVARVPVVAQHNTVQQWPTAVAQTTSRPLDTPVTHNTQLETFPTSPKKRSAETAIAEPVAKRWQIEAYPGAQVGAVSKSSHVWDVANAVRLSAGGKRSIAAGGEDYEMAEGLKQHTGMKLKVVLSRAASEQKSEVMDESGHV